MQVKVTTSKGLFVRPEAKPAKSVISKCSKALCQREIIACTSLLLDNLAPSRRNIDDAMEFGQLGNKVTRMKTLNLLTLILLIVGGLNWGLVGVADFDLVAAIFGDGSALSRAVYVLVGLSALYQILPLTKAFQIDEPQAEAARRA
jgi:uncharacterized protein